MSYPHTESDARLLKRFAPHDLISSLACVIGFRDHAYRQKAIDALQLEKGDRVIEIGCGTGRNFAMLERAVGPHGIITGVDLSDTMIARARKRAGRQGWSNIELVQGDATPYRFPGPVDGILFTYSLVIIPEYDRVIQRAFEALSDGKRCVVLDQKLPSGLALRVVPLLDFLSRPLNYSQIAGERCVWESIRRHAGNVRIQELYFGFVYLAVGEKNASSTT